MNEQPNGTYLEHSSVQFSHSVMSNSLQLHELEHIRLPCPSPTLEFTQTHVHWVGDAIQPSHPLLSSSPPALNLEFCQENTLVIANTLFQQHKRRLYMWTSPDGQQRNQIDYILCSQKWRNFIHSAKTRLGADCGSDHELLIAKFRLKLKKVGKTTRPFRYGLNQIPYDYTVEVRNRFKGLDLIDRVPDELWTEIRAIVEETGSQTTPKKKKKNKIQNTGHYQIRAQESYTTKFKFQCCCCFFFKRNWIQDIR